ncbi:nickel transporter [Enemella evansiae]|uniref:HoxN/HupN/NixA family nickel/cobalt transporter n=1 Tax=Enemella evansiae TaxID=2016499 RepID=UPI000B97A14F|nr:hypothetical protein [Enemella evansiae]OYO02854.1 nickel transporter [Enemella evansiae]
MSAGAPAVGWRSLLTRSGRRSAPLRLRAAAALSVVAVLHLLGLALLGVGLATTPAGVLTLGMAGFAYTRGWLHSLDADHLAMIDNSTRKFLAEGHRPAAVGLAFSGGHSTVVVIAGIAVVAGVGWIREAADPGTALAGRLGLIGGLVSAGYLLLVAAANLPTLIAAWRDRRTSGAAGPRPLGLMGRVLRAPLARVRHAGHIYWFGVLFGLGFDTASTLSILMLTAAAGVAGAPPLTLLALPLLFAAGMTLGDSVNQLLMLRLYTAAVADRSRARLNLVVTAISIGAALAVAILTLAGIAAEHGWAGGVVTALAEVDTQWWGVGLLAVFAVVAASWALRRGFRSSDAPG